VRCASCGHTWRHSPEAAGEPGAAAPATPAAPLAAEPPAAVPPPAPRVESPRVEAARLESPRVEPPSEAGAPLPAPVVTPRPAPVSEPPAAPRRHIGAGLAWAALVLVVAAIVLVAVLFRDRVVAIWPGASRVYTFAHLQTEQPGAGLEIKVTPTRNGDSLVIDGDITNTAGTARNVPRLRVALRDASKNELDSKTIDPPVQRLLPGAAAHFTTSFANPNPNATGVAVTFASQ
jgi:hypothetical protein